MENVYRRIRRVLLANISDKHKKLAAEFLRYAVVGGTAFLVDYGTYFLMRTYVFNGLGDTGIYIATAIGFTLGLVYNYILSLIFVFRSAREQNKGKTVGAFILFAVIGIIGLGLSEGGMYVVYGLLRVPDLIARVLVAGVVLIWNYAARKLLIFR